RPAGGAADRFTVAARAVAFLPLVGERFGLIGPAPMDLAEDVSLLGIAADRWWNPRFGHRAGDCAGGQRAGDARAGTVRCGFSEHQGFTDVCAHEHVFGGRRAGDRGAVVAARFAALPVVGEVRWFFRPGCRTACEGFSLLGGPGDRRSFLGYRRCAGRSGDGFGWLRVRRFAPCDAVFDAFVDDDGVADIIGTDRVRLLGGAGDRDAATAGTFAPEPLPQRSRAG